MKMLKAIHSIVIKENKKLNKSLDFEVDLLEARCL